MKRLVSLIVGLTLSSAFAANGQAVEIPADPATARALHDGPVVGYVDAATGAQAWRAIPFARPPVGDLRWRAPRPAEAWSAPRISTKAAPWCPQQLSAMDGVDRAKFGQIAGQEDCLYLDVYAPPMTTEAAASAKLPIMMWIHGGSNTWGRAEQYDGSALAARFKVVVVVVQYRLGALGWFAHPALREGGTLAEDASANFGTLDQIRALEWIQQNGAAFGGDTSRVTIFGESAGGQNVATLLTSPRAKGLFHRAVIQSGSFKSEPLDLAEGKTGSSPVSGTTIAAKIVGSGQPVTAAALRSAPVSAIYDAYKAETRDLDPFRIIADGIVVPAAGLDSVLDAPSQFNAVPVITGTNRDEMKLFNALNPKFVKYVAGKLPVARDPAFYEAASFYPSRMWRANAVDGPANRMAAGGHGPVWAYRFDWKEEGKVLVTDLGQLLGAGHSIEIPFVFGHFKLLGAFDSLAFNKDNAPGRIALSDTMMSYWVNFAATGAPGKGVDGKLPEWKTWTPSRDAPNLMVFDSPKAGGSRMITDHETPARIADDLLADKTLKSEDQRCQILKGLTRDNPEIKDKAATCG
ncbi:MAG: carboxylesterase [Alphaproteobacteria bacterium PA2]|nr:MAG: carboxylesterase [Alphaproteobacteria bacterium PA2]